MAKKEFDVLVFCHQSVDAAPGFGNGENVCNFEKYEALGKIPNWRRILSSLHVCRFFYRGKTYRSIEHALQAAKIAIADPEMAELFTIESRSKLGLGTGEDARDAKRMVELTVEQMNVWNNKRYQEMVDITIAKVHQCCVARRVLMLTMDAQLWHYQRGIPLTQFIHLEEIRDTLH